MKNFGPVGIDVSHWQGKVDWKRVIPAVSFAFVKATEGAGFVDACWERNADALSNASMPWGAYHFFRPDSGEKQAEKFLTMVERYIQHPQFLTALDVEVGEADDWCQISVGVLYFLEMIARATGKKPILYTRKSFFDAVFQHAERKSENEIHIGGPLRRGGVWGEYPLWVAHYPKRWKSAQTPKIPAPWEFWHIWQYTDSGRVPGIEVLVDLNFATDHFFQIFQK